jgi:colanic acid biosynthesis protein WcaH
MISIDKFRNLVANAPLITIDFMIKNALGNILLGKRVNKPAKGYYFTAGGRIFKNETIEEAIKRISLKELNFKLALKDLQFIGIFEQFFEDSIFERVSLRSIDMVYEYQCDREFNLPTIEHNEYRFFSMDEIQHEDAVHPCVKEFFCEETCR